MRPSAACPPATTITTAPHSDRDCDSHTLRHQRRMASILRAKPKREHHRYANRFFRRNLWNALVRTAPTRLTTTRYPAPHLFSYGNPRRHYRLGHYPGQADVARSLRRNLPKARVQIVKLNDFKKYLNGKSLDNLLHQARKSSLSRIVANQYNTVALRKKGRISTHCEISK